MNILKKIKHIIEYVIFYPLYLLKTKKKYNIVNENLVIDQIINNKKSLARFGDGEFKWILNVPQKSFQKQNDFISHSNLQKHITRICTNLFFNFFVMCILRKRVFFYIYSSLKFIWTVSPHITEAGKDFIIAATNYQRPRTVNIPTGLLGWDECFNVFSI